MGQINKLTFRQRMRSYKKNPISFMLFLLVVAAACITAGVLLLLVGYILFKGVPHLSADLFAWKYSSENVSLLPALLNTVLITIISLFIAAPLGIFSAIYLVEYSKKGSKFVEAIRLTTETLSGIPSIVFGLFGLLFFVTALKLGMSLIAGVLTLSIMILPLIIRTSEEALKSVPIAYREGSFGLGAGRLRTVFRIVLPPAIPGILAGVVLGIGRIVGESAALIYTAGTVAETPGGADFLLDSTRSLAVHMYVLSSEGLFIDKTYATAVVLLILVVGINWLSGFLAKKIGKGQSDE